MSIFLFVRIKSSQFVSFISPVSLQVWRNSFHLSWGSKKGCCWSPRIVGDRHFGPQLDDSLCVGLTPVLWWWLESLKAVKEVNMPFKAEFSSSLLNSCHPANCIPIRFQHFLLNRRLPLLSKISPFSSCLHPSASSYPRFRGLLGLFQVRLLWQNLLYKYILPFSSYFSVCWKIPSLCVSLCCTPATSKIL